MSSCVLPTTVAAGVSARLTRSRLDAHDKTASRDSMALGSLCQPPTCRGPRHRPHDELIVSLGIFKTWKLRWKAEGKGAHGLPQGERARRSSKSKWCARARGARSGNQARRLAPQAHTCWVKR